MAISLTLVSFADPENHPMIDTQVVKWINNNADLFNKKRQNKLTKFNFKYTSPRIDDFESYLNWLLWCNEIAKILSSTTKIKWRTRDVEMAIFTSQRIGLNLNILFIS